MINDMTNSISDFDICTWISEHSGQTTDEIMRIVKNEHLYKFLLAWSVMERVAFSRNCSHSNIRESASLLGNHYKELDCEAIFKHFFDRYQDKQKLINLNGNSNRGNLFSDICNILRSNQSEIGDAEKLLLLLYIAYRFRNNIFHGNKEVEDWLMSQTEINMCTRFIMKYTDISKFYQTGGPK